MFSYYLWFFHIWNTLYMTFVLFVMLKVILASCEVCICSQPLFIHWVVLCLCSQRFCICCMLDTSGGSCCLVRLLCQSIKQNQELMVYNLS